MRKPALLLGIKRGGAQWKIKFACVREVFVSGVSDLAASGCVVTDRVIVLPVVTSYGDVCLKLVDERQ